jgi:LVIVD repeat
MRRSPVRRSRGRGVGRTTIVAAAAFVLVGGVMPLAATAQGTGVPDSSDPRVGLTPGYFPWTEASSNIELLDNDPRVAPFDAAPGNFGFVNSDLAFSGTNAVVGSFHGFQIYDISNPTNPVLRSSFVCPGGQGDPSVYGNLLFMSVEETRGRIDCGTQGAAGAVNPERFRGVRIFDISDIDNPVQLPGVQLCRGSHTHTLVEDPDDPANIYVYNSGTSGVRPAAELAGCENAALTQSPVTTGNPTQWRIDVIKVPLAAPETAAVVSQPRIFTDPATGAFNGLQNTLPGALHPSGTAYSPLPNTNTCHDVTNFPDRELLAGACQGNGILVDVSDPVNPVRLDAVADPNFSYWHSATFNNDGTKVLFTDEWGGGTSPRCRVTDRLEWGADALFDVVNGKMQFRTYYKMPAVQTSQENCVAHNASIIPVPNRDIMTQAWYQGGISVIDFTDTANPVEIAYLDRGPINVPNPTGLNLGGLWSTYWYNGLIYGTEIARGFDTFGLLPSDMMSTNEIAAASEVKQTQFNAQLQSELTAEPSYTVVAATIDQAVRAGTIDARTLKRVQDHIDRAKSFEGGPQAHATAAQLDAAAESVKNKPGLEDLSRHLSELADTKKPK